MKLYFINKVFLDSRIIIVTSTYKYLEENNDNFFEVNIYYYPLLLDNDALATTNVARTTTSTLVADDAINRLLIGVRLSVVQ